MTLDDLKESESVVISGFSQDLDDTYRTRLVELGFEVSQKVICFRRPPFGAPGVYQIGGSVFSLSSDVAKLITVKMS